MDAVLNVCVLVSQLVCVEDVLSSSLIKGAPFKDWGCNKNRQLEAPHLPSPPPPHPGAREQIDGVQGVGVNHGVTNHISGLIKRRDATVGPARIAF